MKTEALLFGLVEYLKNLFQFCKRLLTWLVRAQQVSKQSIHLASNDTQEGWNSSVFSNFVCYKVELNSLKVGLDAFVMGIEMLHLSEYCSRLYGVLLYPPSSPNVIIVWMELPQQLKYS